VSVEAMTLGLDGRVVITGHYMAPLTFGGPTLTLELGNPDANPYSYAVAFANTDGAHVFTTHIPATRLTGADANGGLLVIAGEELNVLGSDGSVLVNGWGRSGRVVLGPSNRLYWDLSLMLWGLDRSSATYPYLIVLQP
jgi:hypothetical protein